jgi:hypothetical protein
MKKLLLVAVAGMFVLASCKKDYTCECTESGVIYKYTMTESKKAAAAAMCEGKGIGGIKVDGVSVPQEASNCSLK